MCGRAVGGIAVAWAGTLCLLLPGRAKAEEPLGVDGLRLPLSYFEGGGIKRELYAREAEVPDDGVVRAKDVEVRFYREDGEIDAVLRTEECKYNQKLQYAVSKTDFRLDRGNATVEGEGFRWYGEEERIWVLEDVEVTIQHGPSGDPADGESGKGYKTELEADRLDYFYGENIAVFTKEVRVEDPRLDIWSDKLTVLMTSSNTMKSATATGNVKLRREDMDGVCEKAIFLAEKDEVILAGAVRLERPSDSIEGKMITYDLANEIVRCTEGRIESPGGGEEPDPVERDD